MLAPFENERSTRFQYSEAFLEPLGQHFFPSREKTTVVFQYVAFSCTAFRVVWRIHHHHMEGFSLKRQLCKICKHIWFDFDPRYILPTLARFFVLFLASIYKDGSGVVLVKPH